MDPQVPIEDQIPNNKSQLTNGTNNVTVISMAVFVLLSLSAVGFLYYQNQQLKKMLTNYNAPVVSPTPSPTSTSTPAFAINPKTGWKIDSRISDFTFEFPSDWIEQKDKSLQSDDTTMSLSIAERQGIEYYFKVTSKTRIINGIKMNLEYYSGADKNGDIGSKRLIFVAIPKTKNNLAIYFTYDSSNQKVAESIFDQILSTFQFTGPSEASAKEDKFSPTPKACTQEAKLCSDGSYVGRIGPNCEFAPCP